MKALPGATVLLLGAFGLTGWGGAADREDERSDLEALQKGFGRLNAAVFWRKYAREVMTLGRGG